MSFGDPKVGIVSSITSIIGNRFFDHLQAVEWILNQTMGSGGIGNGVPFGCFGNNLSVRADTYNKLGGYGKIKFSVTEDLALLQAVVHSGERARYYPDKDSLVFTKPCETFGEFKRQNHRWAVGGLDLGLKGWGFVAANFLIWLGIAYSIIAGDYLLLASLIATRVIGDLILITPTLVILREFRLFLGAIPSLFLLMIWELFIPILVILNSEVKWKGQVFKAG
jgi:cellulose synthase/poly-beta-1,6-N-acetylglucosamine synthase-like glycosyltransferase